MKEAPFNITLVLLAVLGFGLVAGGILGSIFGFIGINGFLGLFLTGFCTIPLTSIVRKKVASVAAAFEGVEGKSPTAFSLPGRLIIGAVVSALVALLFRLGAQEHMGFLLGALTGMIVQTILIIVFYIGVSISGPGKK